LAETDLVSALGLAALIGLVPIYLGMSQTFISKRFRDETKSIIHGAAFGAMAFFLVDVFEGASGLGVEFGLRYPYIQATLVASFAVGLLVPAMLEPRHAAGYHKLAYLFAMGIGFHSLAEGVVIGYDLQAGHGFTLLQRTVQTLSFVLHKGAEGLAISIPLMFMRPVNARAVVYSGLVGGVPLMLGTGVGFAGLSGVAASYSFAAGAGGTIYLLFRLASISIKGRRLYLGILLGVLYMYFAGMIHAVEV